MVRFIHRHRLGRVLACLLALSLVVSTVASAAGRRKRPPRRSRNIYQKYKETYASALVVEAESGKILFEKSPDEPRAPASLTKMMTELLALEALNQGRVRLVDTVTVPADVGTIRGSRVRLRPGERLPFGEALRAMAISSANDAAFTIANYLGGSEPAFVDLMNRRARELGMSHTHYVNAHGLDRNDQPGSITTARDLSLLARQLVSHPLTLEISSTVADTIRGCQVIHTTNRLLGTCEGVDGLKTGYTGKAGFCLCSTAERDGMRVVSVLLGASSNRRRFSESAGLLASAFERFRRIAVIRKGQDLDRVCSILGGSAASVRLVAGEDVSVLLSINRMPDIRVMVDAPFSIASPVLRGTQIGLLRVLVGDSLAATVPAVTARDVSKATLLDKLGARFFAFD
jgi:serine-type D-Ala-D-Ala carboxypeptidase (penicillin-binding protein 5/6)